MSSDPVRFVPVTFRDNTLSAVRTADNRVMISLTSLCAPMGLDAEAQRQRLQDPERCPWVDGRAFVTKAHDVSGRPQDVYCIDFDILPMWLATISVARVRPEFREKVIAYQRECADVLRNHFFGPQTSGDPLLDSIAALQRQTEAILEMRRRQIETEKEVAAVRAVAESAANTAGLAGELAAAALRTAESCHGYMAVLGYCKITNREVTIGQASAHGRKLTKICESRNIPVHFRIHEFYGKVNTYPLSILQEYFADEVDPVIALIDKENKKGNTDVA